MKSNKTFNYVSKFKFLMLVPLVLALVAVVIGAIFNFNLDYDFQKVSNFTVKFNTTVTDAEYDAFETTLEEIVENNDFSDYRIERVGEGAQNGLIVKVPNNEGKLDARLNTLRTNIEDTLLSETEGVESNVVVTTSELTFSQPRNATKLIWFSVLAIVCVVAFVIVYKWIRYNLMSGLTLATSIALEISMLVSVLVLARIPVNYYIMVPFEVMIITTLINSTIMDNSIKNSLSLDEKMTNEERVLRASKESYKIIAFYMLFVLVAIMGLVFFGNDSLIYLGLAIVAGLFVSAFVSLFISNSLWAFWYNKENDKVLVRRIETEKKRLEAKNNKNKQPDDKIVV